MCGIAGIIDISGKAVTQKEIKEMTDVIVHRGPDGEGFFMEDNFALGHRRLSIIDLSIAANQPMHFNKSLTIVFNGEIYNYIELRNELQKFDYTFNTSSDTEVILAAYDFWGESCVGHFNGMWAFAIYNKTKKQIFCSRDRFGIKPFYYTEKNNRFYFGSEIKQLLIHHSEIVANQQVLLDYLFIGIEEYNDETFFSGIRKLSQGHNLIYDLQNNSIRIKPYYSLHINPETASFDFQKAKQLFRDLFNDSINLRLRSDVKVGTCLSGGLDSSSIAAIASRKYEPVDSNEKIGAVHAKSTEKISDESNFAKKVANEANLDLHITEPQKENFDKILQEVVKIQEEPFGSPSILMQYFVFKEARKQGLVVMLDGQGGDELLLGYDRYFVAWLRSNNLINRIFRFKNIVKNSRLSSIQLLKFYLYFNADKIRAATIRKKFSFIRKEYLKQLNLDILRKLSQSFLNLNQLQIDEVSKYQLPHLLKYEDKNSMAHSIESRLPFLDYRFLEFSLSLPAEYKIQKGWSKYILRKSLEGQLHADILWRKNKFGFEAPTKTWIADKEKILSQIKDSQILQKILKSTPENFDDLLVIWRLYNIALWEKQFNVKWNGKC
jgi:asparagine synthase (glutamine-hydrolysing)